MNKSIMTRRISLAISLCIHIFICITLFGFSPFSKKNEIISQANKQFQERDYQKSLQSYEEFLKEHSNYPEVNYNKGASQFFLKEYDSAIQSFSKSLGAKDQNIRAETQRALGNTYLQLNEFDKAISAFKQALIQNPSLDSAKRAIEIAYELKRRAKSDQKPQEDQDKQNQDKQEQEQDKNSEQKPKEQNNTDQQKEQNQKQEQEQQNEQKQKNEQPQTNAQQNQEQQDNNNQPSLSPAQQQKDEQQKKEENQNLQNTIDILNALQENEKPFQLFLFQQPKTQKRSGQKDW